MSLSKLTTINRTSAAIQIVFLDKYKFKLLTPLKAYHYYPRKGYMKFLLLLPAICLPTFLFKITVYGCNAAEAVVFTALCALYAGWFYMTKTAEPEANKELKNRLVDLEEQVKIQKDKVSSFTLTSGLRK